MSSMRDVPVSTDVFSAIWAARKPGEHSEDAILRRLLGVASEASGTSQKPKLLRPVPSHPGDDELREAVSQLHTVSMAPKPANIDKPSGQTGAITSTQRRWEKLADTLADPFRLVY